MEKPSNQRIAVSITLLLIGCAWFAAPWYSNEIFRTLSQALFSDWFRIGAVFAGSAIAGAGIGNFFRRPLVGALCGLSTYLTYRVIIVVFVHHLRVD